MKGGFSSTTKLMPVAVAAAADTQLDVLKLRAPSVHSNGSPIRSSDVSTSRVWAQSDA